MLDFSRYAWIIIEEYNGDKSGNIPNMSCSINLKVDIIGVSVLSVEKEIITGWLIIIIKRWRLLAAPATSPVWCQYHYTTPPLQPLHQTAPACKLSLKQDKHCESSDTDSLQGPESWPTTDKPQQPQSNLETIVIINNLAKTDIILVYPVF